ncbi:MAG: hypothetical protein ACI9TH_003394 [Kiritimatiellia bacterium]|jgi:uncharacterized protein (DUF1501 family)
MNILTRRHFFKRSTLGAIAGLTTLPGFMQRAVEAGLPTEWNGNKLLFVFLRGGNDSLNSLVPTGDPAYNTDLRPTLHIPGPSAGLTSSGLFDENPEAGRGIDCGNGFASLHPNLDQLAPMYNAGDLALVHRVGYPNQNRSHFESEQYWESGVPRKGYPQEGIFYRTVTETGWSKQNPLSAVTMGSNSPLSVRGRIPLTNIRRPSRFDLLGVYPGARNKHIEAIQRMYGHRYPEKQHRELVHEAGGSFVRSIDQIQGIDFDANGRDGSNNKISGSPFLDDDLNETQLFPTGNNTDDQSFGSNTAFNFLEKLKHACQLLHEGNAIIAGTELGGFDTHDDQGLIDSGHGRRMRYLGQGLHAVRKYLSHPSVNIWDKTIVVTLSEFGRTSKENSSGGTDHAEAGCMFLASGNPAFQGGVHQCDGATWPGGDTGAMFLENDRYLGRSVDYRSVLGEVIRKHLGASQAHLNSIIPGYSNAAEQLLAGGLSIDGVDITGELGLFG